MPVRVYSFPHLYCRTGMRARLLLENGMGFEGCGFGAKGVKVGEVVFSTSMTGYPESLTDPSYEGQILVYTHPMVGNYGVPSKEFRVEGIPACYESDRIHVEGFIIGELPEPSHYLSSMSLSDWLRSESVPGMYRVDTRMIVKTIRSKGVMMGVIAVYSEDEEPPAWSRMMDMLRRAKRYDELKLAYRVSPLEPIEHTPVHAGYNGRTVAVLDCGLKYGILRELLKRGFRVVRYPCWSKAEEVVEEADAVLLSNGPGNPSILDEAIKAVQGILEYRLPVLAICLGMQLLCVASGAKTFKLPYGHRGPNKPVVDLDTGRCFVTTQNHGYAVDAGGLAGTGLRLRFLNPDDKTVEGVVDADGRVLAVQFHPEGGPGPHDSTWMFDWLARRVKA